MSAKHRNALIAARAALVEHVHVGEGLLSELISDFIIRTSVKEEIMVSNRWLTG